jgi:hypothetical protein
VGAMEEDGKLRVEKFNGQNYQLWNMQMEDYLYQKDLFLPLGGIEKNLTTMKDEEWEILDRKALGMIRMSLAASVAFNILKENTMKELMDALAKLYKKPMASNKVFLMKKLFNMNMSEGGSIADHLNEFNTITNQLSSVSNFVSSSNTLKFYDFVGVILSEEMRQKITGETSSNALNMEVRGRQKDRGKVSGIHENSRKGISKSRLGKIECWDCGKKGHLKKYCRAPKKQRDG